MTRLAPSALAAIAAALMPAPAARAIIVHPDDAVAVPAALANVAGRWATNASAVAIGPNHVLTTRHQGGGVGTTVTFGGVPYVVAQQTPIGAADLRVCRIERAPGVDAGLASFVPVYAGDDAVAPAQPTTLVGFGRGRGTELTTAGGTYGYAWGDAGTAALRAGRNLIDGEEDNVEYTIIGPADLSTNMLVADFDRRSAPSAVAGEATVAEFDSGAGWFVEDGPGNWRVRAITAAVDHVGTNDAAPANQALFASQDDATVGEPDLVYGVRLADYAGQISAAVPEPGTAGLAGAAGIGILARRRRRAELMDGSMSDSIWR